MVTTQPTPEELKPPFTVDEAELPQGFPQPGPVDVIIVKQYPAYRGAFITSKDDPRGENSMFRPLFNHIKKNDISMSSPVEMAYPLDAKEGTKATSMAFLYGNPNAGQLGKDGIVQIIDVPAMTVLSIGVRGSYSAANFRANVEKLTAWLDKNDLTYHPVGAPRYLAYNSPFVPWFMKYAEVQIPIVRHPAKPQ